MTDETSNDAAEDQADEAAEQEAAPAPAAEKRTRQRKRKPSPETAVEKKITVSEDVPDKPAAPQVEPSMGPFKAPFRSKAFRVEDKEGRLVCIVGAVHMQLEARHAAAAAIAQALTAAQA